jgi:hypothetical protein
MGVFTMTREQRHETRRDIRRRHDARRHHPEPAGEPVLRLFHRTTPAAADAIVGTGAWLSAYPDGSVWFSTYDGGQATGYGDACVAVDVPASLAELDDEFPDGECHYRVPATALAGLPAQHHPTHH